MTARVYIYRIYVCMYVCMYVCGYENSITKILNEQVEKLTEELRRLSKLVEDKETELKNKNSARLGCPNLITLLYCAA